MKKIVECVPNFSEGRNEDIIRSIAQAIKGTGEVKLLNISSGRSANRTVITFAGSPEVVSEAAFQGIKRASELIDMSLHKGVHPRMGATDVCPLIPLSGISMEETIQLSHALAKRVGEELHIPVYCYEQAAFSDERRSLANCRSGEYERLKEKISTERWKPDFGPACWSCRVAVTGATVIGARNILVAYNVNLDTGSVKVAREIASEIRKSGRWQAAGKSEEKMHIPGTLEKVRAIGWYLEDPGVAQVSMNLTDISVTPVHKAYEEVSRKALEKGCKVTGSELVGLIPLQSLLDAGRYFSSKQSLPPELSEEELIRIAVESLGLNDLYPFDPGKRVIEYLIK
ncbi:MAG: glutamate formimidoyltransferase [Prolixibacteraceae bacterium]|nr:glutamate formimidoyltransferase [Prolixibacteraceae bacterium]